MARVDNGTVYISRSRRSTVLCEFLVSDAMMTVVHVRQMKSKTTPRVWARKVTAKITAS